jgi:hypothetical protein
MTGALVLAGLMVAGSVLLDLQAESTRSIIIQTYVLIERLIVSGLLIVLLIFAVFLAYFPVRLNRNAVLHTRIFTSFFFAKTVLLIFRNLFEAAMALQINLVLQLVSTACLIGWGLFLNPSGEATPDQSSRRSDPESEARLNAQLEALNQMLAGSTKK